METKIEQFEAHLAEMLEERKSLEPTSVGANAKNNLAYLDVAIGGVRTAIANLQEHVKLGLKGD